ncbi:glucose dehydrogenase [FAD, quinone]-like [Episyrphus balteatus]|uniref:glucose dehydrogenase [FAD, quinone]-like n=1 Tax=Episyrphus balteatus TaxID=286459 RepID=UPI0024866B47|nr:glucose dehydrogenase [FAD, quinone]-like [Episyrphus balteatus]
MKTVESIILSSALLFISLQLIEAANPFDYVFKRAAEENQRDREKRQYVPKDNSIFDFIIVGGGSAGCLLANRLSENPRWSVLLIEAGGNENIVHDMPILAPNLQKTDSDWQYQTTPQENACFGMRDRKCSLPHGKVLGGSSSINYLYYTRGNMRDYYNWAALGNYGWSFPEVFHYYMKSEGAYLKGLEQSPWHNRTGELSVEFVEFRSEIAKYFVKGAQDAGLKSVDYNGYSQLGVSFAQATTRNGHRASSSKSFIEPIRYSRKNLHVINYSTVIKIIIDPITLTALGVEHVYKGKVYSVHSRKETILSAGALHSPQLLMLSGIGPGENLQRVGISQLVELPVGQVLYDQVTHFGPVFTTNTTGSTLFGNTITQKDLDQYFAGSAGTRISSTAGFETLAFFRTRNSRTPTDVPNIEIAMGAVGLASDGGTTFKTAANFRDDVYQKAFSELENRDHFTTIPVLLYPKSKGSLRLRDRNPFSPPEINPNYLKEQEDVEFLLEGIKEAIRIAETPSMQKINATLWKRNVPGCEHLKFGTDEYWRCSIRVLSYNFYHYIGTCRMGPHTDPMAVVSPELKVRGVRRLRVVDNSVVPTMPAGHTAAVALMIAEKAADLIKQEWEQNYKININT